MYYKHFNDFYVLNVYVLLIFIEHTYCFRYKMMYCSSQFVCTVFLSIINMYVL